MNTPPPDLSDLQEAMMRALHGEATDQSLSPHLRAAADKPVTSPLSIYRHSMQATRITALRLSYRAVERLVGTDFFTAAAALYVRTTPSEHGDLDRYGATFGDHLGKLPAAADLPWLPDLARLEWRLEQLHRCAPETALTRNDLAHPDAATFDDRSLRLVGRAALFESPWPVVRIWLAHRENPADPDLDAVDSRPDRALVHAGEPTQVTLLDEASWSFFRALEQGGTLLVAVNQALAIDPEFDFQSTFARALDGGALASRPR